MQKLLLYKGPVLLLLIAFFISYSTIQAQNQKERMLKIELGKTFKNDLVKIYLDKKLVYNKQISTPDSSQITDVLNIDKPRKAFTLTVEINGQKFEQSSPKQQKELDKEDYSLLINYDRKSEEVEIKTKIVIVIYDYD